MNWRVADSSDRNWILKIGPVASASKWRSARLAHDLATDQGVPLPRLTYFAERNGYVVRMYEWVTGQSPAVIAHDPPRVATFFSQLGSAIATLHSIRLDEFSSRLDGSAPSFRRWADYVDYRLHQIRDRCAASDALDRPTLEHTCAVVTDLATEVTAVARPTLCHRDLHQDNLLVDDSGSLLAILDWDAAEAWDPAGEWFKLDWMLFPQFPGGETSFLGSYARTHPDTERWDQRRHLTDLLESLNAVANAAGEPANPDYETRARARLQWNLDQT